MGILQIIRLLQVLQTEPEQYPHIPAEQFAQWRGLELNSALLFFLALLCLGAGLGLPFLLSDGSQGQQDVSPMVPWCLGGGVLLFVIFLVVSAVFGSMAAKLRKTLQIRL